MSADDAITTPTTPTTTRKKTVVVLPSSDSPTNDTNKSTVITKKRVSYNHNNNNNKKNNLMMNDTWYQLSKGWSDASNITHLLKLFAKSPKFQVIFRSCFLLNGLIFVGSILVLDYIFSPLFFHLIGSAITASSSSHFNDDEMMTTRTRTTTTGSGLLSILYLSIKNMFWMWPMYTISLALCTSWYNHVADLAYRYSQKVAHLRNHRASARNSFNNNNSSDDFSSSLKNSGNGNSGNGNNSGSSSGMDDVTRTRTVIVDKVSDGIYRSILLLVFLLQMNLLGSLPSFIGPIVSLCLTSWLYAFYAFDYVWTYKNYNTQQRLNYFERHWAYMLGFGAPNALTSYFFPFFINAGVWAMLFPIFIVLAMMANPPPVAPDTKPLPIFYFVKKCLNYVLLTIGDVIAKKMKQSPSVNSVASPPSAFSMNIAKVFLQDDEDAADDGDDDDDSKRKTEPMKE